MPPECLAINSRPPITVLAPFWFYPFGKFVNNNAVPFLCFKDVLSGENNGFGLVKDPCHLPGPGSRYVCVFLMPCAL